MCVCVFVFVAFAKSELFWLFLFVQNKLINNIFQVFFSFFYLVDANILSEWMTFDFLIRYFLFAFCLLIPGNSNCKAHFGFNVITREKKNDNGPIKTNGDHQIWNAIGLFRMFFLAIG